MPASPRNVILGMSLFENPKAAWLMDPEDLKRWSMGTYVAFVQFKRGVGVFFLAPGAIALINYRLHGGLGSDWGSLWADAGIAYLRAAGGEILLGPRGWSAS